MAKFKEGDRVRFIYRGPSFIPYESVGTVVGNMISVQVRWDFIHTVKSVDENLIGYDLGTPNLDKPSIDLMRGDVCFCVDPEEPIIFGRTVILLGFDSPWWLVKCPGVLVPHHAVCPEIKDTDGSKAKEDRFAVRPENLVFMMRTSEVLFEKRPEGLPRAYRFSPYQQKKYAEAKDDVEIIIDPKPEQVPKESVWGVFWHEIDDIDADLAHATSRFDFPDIVSEDGWKHCAILTKGQLSPSELAARVRKMLVKKVVL